LDLIHDLHLSEETPQKNRGGAGVQLEEQNYAKNPVRRRPAGLKIGSLSSEGKLGKKKICFYDQGAPDISVERCIKYVSEDGNCPEFDCATRQKLIEEIKNDGPVRKASHFFSQERFSMESRPAPSPAENALDQKSSTSW